MRILTSCALALCGVLLPSVSASAESWRFAGYVEEYPALVAYVDADSLVRSGSIADFTILQFDEDFGSDWLKQHIRADCTKTGYSILDSKTLENGVVKDAEGEPSAVDEIKAGSVDELVIDLACGRAKMPAATPDPAKDAAKIFASLN